MTTAEYTHVYLPTPSGILRCIHCGKLADETTVVGNEIFTAYDIALHGGRVVSQPVATNRFELVRSAVAQLSPDDQRKLYEFLHQIGHRIFREG